MLAFAGGNTQSKKVAARRFFVGQQKWGGGGGGGGVKNTRGGEGGGEIGEDPAMQSGGTGGAIGFHHDAARAAMVPDFLKFVIEQVLLKRPSRMAWK